MTRKTTQGMAHRPTQKEKTLRAFRAYLDLLDTADWFRGKLRGQLEGFDLTLGGFRLLEMLYREGPMQMRTAAERLRCKRQNLDAIVDRLEERRWVCREFATLPPVEIKPSHIAIAKRDLPREGRRIGVVRLTPLGEKFIGIVFPKHAKMVKAMMRVLDAREQESISRVCRKLREGDVWKFTREIMLEEVDE